MKTIASSPFAASGSQLSRCISLAVIFLFSLNLEGATVTRSGLLVVNSRDSALGGAFELGDIFNYTLSYDDAILDSESDPDYGEFLGAITSFTIMPDTVRSGIWAPSGSMGSGTVTTETGAVRPWTFSVTADLGFGPQVGGFDPTLIYMGFGGLPANGDIGGEQTLGQVTGSILDYVTMGASNLVEFSFENGTNGHVVNFDLINFHAPEPSRSVLVLAGLMGLVWRRTRR